MQVLVDDGVALAVRTDGANDAEAVVLIHGFPLAKEIWDAQAQSLARAHRVVRPDLRGMGASSVPPGPYLMETLASDIAAVLDALAIERATLVGHSLGGYVALAFARMFSERVRRMALVCSRLGADDRERAAARLELADRVEREGSIDPVLDAFVPRLFSPERYAAQEEIVAQVRALASRTDPAGAAAALRGMALRDSAQDIAADLDLPVTIVAGGCDATIPAQEAAEIARAFAQGELVECPRSGHLPMLEEPAAVTEALERLLARPA